MGNTTASQDEFLEKVYTYGSAIPLRCYQVIPGVISGIAIVSVVARSGMRLWTRRPLYWDDLVLAIGAASFVAATALFYINIYYWYLEHALDGGAVPFSQVPPDDFQFLMAHAFYQFTGQNATTWTTIFCVKASFLIIIKQLLKRLVWLNIYFWFVVGFTFASWAISLSSEFISCPYTGWATVQCNVPSRESLEAAVLGLATALDVFSDMMIASIPIIFLWRSQLDPKQKLVVGPFLCLSLVMIIFSIIRITRNQGVTGTDFAWMAFWQHLEAGVALIVTSIVTIRTVFVARKQRKTQDPSSDRLIHKVGSATGRQQATNNSKAEEDDRSAELSNRTLVELPARLMELPKPSEILVHDSWEVSYA